VKKSLVLCADDFAISEPVSDAIVRLANENRISATSCLTSSPLWPKLAVNLHVLDSIDVGLHLELTEYQGYRLPTLLIQSYLRRLSVDRLLDIIQTQVDHFTEHMGRLPDFIDGHQHVHQFPRIRNALLVAYARNFSHSKSYIRCTAPQVAGGLKGELIARLGGHALRRRLRHANIPHNQTFAGAYHFKAGINYRNLFNRVLQESQDGGLVMCHPGVQHENDPIASMRGREYSYLMSDDFIADCEQQRVTISRFNTSY